MYETGEMEIRVQVFVLWDGTLAAGRGRGMDICKEVFGFEELGPFRWGLV